MNTRLIAIIRKEFIHVLRDRRTLLIMFFIPIVQLVILGYSATSDVRFLPTAVYDADQTSLSRQLLDAYRASDYFSITQYASNESDIEALLDRGAIQAGIIIPSGYGDNLMRGGTAQIAILIDGSDPSIATGALSSAQAIGQALGMRAQQQQLRTNVTNVGRIDVRTRALYNPDLRSANYMIPGLIGLILTFSTIQSTALAIVREREQGTIEQLIVTPIRAWELSVGKVIPYTFIALVDLIEILVIGVFWFGVPVRGSIPLLFAMALLFLMTTLGIGLFISATAKTQREAMQLTMLVALPSFFLSGLFFPIQAMPPVLQAISFLVPVRYMLIILRSIVLKGVGLEAISGQAIALVIFGVLILGGASLRFSKRLE